MKVSSSLILVLMIALQSGCGGGSSREKTEQNQENSADEREQTDENQESSVDESAQKAAVMILLRES